MRDLFRFRPSPLLSPVLAALLAVAMVPAVGQAQSKAPAAAAASDEAPPVEQIKLTEKQVEGLLAGQKDIAAVTAKIPDGDSDKPDPKVQAGLDAVAKKYGFAAYAEYDSVLSNVALVMSGFDPDSKTFIGSDAVLKKEMAEVKADKQMSAKDKTKALADLADSLKTAPKVQYPENIKLVEKYYAKLSDAMQQDE